MKQFQVTDPDLLALLRTNAPVDVVDGDGKVIGRVQFQPMTYPEFGMTDEEMHRHDNDPNATWHTTDEVVEWLQRHRRKAS